MNDEVLDQLSKEMAVFAQNNSRSYETMRAFFLYELKLRCVSKRFLAEISKEQDREGGF